jgi:hypothetical protein
MLYRDYRYSDRKEGGYWPFRDVDDSEFHDRLCEKDVVYGEDGCLA